MSGTHFGSIKRKLQLRGQTKPGELIKRMNDINAGAASGVGRMEKAGMKCKTCGMSYKSHSGLKHKFDPMGMVRNVENTVGGAIKTGVNAIGSAARLGGNLGRAFVTHFGGSDVNAILKNKKNGKKSRRSV